MNSMLTALDWHARYTQQARWTRDLRAYLYQKAGLSQAQRVLDVGCGTGVLEAELPAFSQAAVIGLDIDRARLGLAKQTTATLDRIELLQGDALRLPLAANSFDACLCHFLLLWLADPLQAVGEMARVTRPGGSILILAEPDYGGRIDHPAKLAPLGKAQAASLRRQGADPYLGRRLREIVQTTGLIEVESGVLGGQWSGPASLDEAELEWSVLRSDLAGSLPPGELAQLYEIDRRARAEGSRLLFVPTFYSWGNVAN